MKQAPTSVRRLQLVYCSCGLLLILTGVAMLLILGWRLGELLIVGGTGPFLVSPFIPWIRRINK